MGLGPSTDKWLYNPLRYRFGVAAATIVNAAMLGATLFYSCSQAGNPRIALCAGLAIIGGLVSSTILPSMKLDRILDGDRSYTPSPSLKSLIDDTLHTANIDPNDVVVRIVNITDNNLKNTRSVNRAVDYFCNRPAWKTKINHGAFFLANFCAEESDDPKHLMLLGHETVKMLNKSELKAVICHEIGHMKNPDSPPLHGQMNIPIAMNFWMAATGTVINPAIAALNAAAWIGGKVMQGVTGQFDEYRADYCSAVLYPDDQALPSALKKIKGTVRGLLHTYPWYTPTGMSVRLHDMLFDEHPALDKRIAAHRRNIDRLQTSETPPSLSPSL